MAQSKLTDEQKLHIAECYTSDQFWTQDKLASTYHVSRKTIYRVLLDLGVLQPKESLAPGSARIVEVVKAHGLDAETLILALNQPILSRDNMLAVLAKMDLPDLHTLFADVVQLKHQNNHGPTPHAQPPADPGVRAADPGLDDAAVPVV